jgi:hypothetical protein
MVQIALDLSGIYSRPSLFPDLQGCVPMDTSTGTNCLFFVLYILVDTLLLRVARVVSMVGKYP